jgi:hypothetical protein
MALGGTRIAISPNSNRWNYKKTCEVFNGDRPVSWDFKFALPRVCRQIYHETATLVYSENIFSFGYEPHSVYFIDDRKQVQREAITTVEVYRGLLSRLGDIGSVLCTFKSLFNVRKVYVKRADRLFFSWEFLKIDKAKVDVAKGDAGDIEVVFVGC